ncbi:MAG: nucleotidyltransferase [Saprospirales bacterium]|nr:nucleotidyltransferase [Saprospirales bacterium]
MAEFNKQIADEVLRLLKPYAPKKVGIFGSYARGENTSESDLDILISFKNRIGLLKLVQIQQELSDKLGIEVDLITENSLKNPTLKSLIEKDLIVVFDEEK